MDLAKQIIGQCFTAQEARARLEEMKEGQEKEFFGEKKSDPGDAMKEFAIAGEEIDKVPELVVYVAAALPFETQQRLGKKAREVFGRDLFLDFKVDPSLWAGAALAWQGQYRDYSLKMRFENKKDELDRIYEQFIEGQTLKRSDLLKD